MTLANIISVISAVDTIDVKGSKSFLGHPIRYYKGSNQNLRGTWEGTEEELDNLLSMEVELISPFDDVLTILVKN